MDNHRDGHRLVYWGHRGLNPEGVTVRLPLARASGRLVALVRKPPNGGDTPRCWKRIMPGAYSNLLYHLVFSAKERRPLIGPAVKTRLHKYIESIVRGEEGDLLEINGMADHVHLLVRLRPAQAVADVLRLIKANSSKWMNETFRNGPKFAWQEGYAAFTVSQSQVPRLLTYIRGQEKHHGRVDFRSELIALLRRHEIAFEDRFLL